MLEGLSENTLLLLFLIILIGQYVGSFKWRGISLGPSAVFLTAVVFGHYGVETPRIVLELGLALFVYSIGIQVGSSFFRNFRKDARHMVMVAFVMVSSGMAATLIIAYLRHLPIGLAAGLFSGSLTNTPALAAAVGVIEKYGLGDASNVTAGYGITYPLAVIAAVLFVQLLPKIVRKDIAEEEEVWAAEQKILHPPLVFRQFRLENLDCVGQSVKTIGKRYMTEKNSFVMSRVLREEAGENGEMEQKEYVANADFILQKNDIITVVGKEEQVTHLRLFGSEVPVHKLDKDIVMLDAEVTSSQIGNRKIAELDMSKRKVIITRVTRGDMEFSPNGNTVLEFGDILRFVGLYKDTIAFAGLVGAKNKKLEETSLLTFIFGLVFGLALGAISVPIMGGSPVSLGYAGGALIAGLLLSTKKRLGKLEIYVPLAALKVTQDLGLMLFMAGAGLIAGGRFINVFHQYGFELIIEGALITLVTLVSGALYMRLAGVRTLATMAAIAAGMTQPSALEVTKQKATTELPLIAYASVYPFAMILKIVLVQILVAVASAL
ncbi:MAG: TrkA C-terminal domain-containing protein [Candidatus Moranbacteria bacterium]|nr:TrkA C-terminal domain-containing protein [Candidatus Moranbacteria bacterium]